MVEDASLIQSTRNDIFNVEQNTLIDRVQERKQEEMKLREIQKLLLGGSSIASNNINGKNRLDGSSKINRNMHDLIQPKREGGHFKKTK
jgi:hypothetical protein